MPDITLVAESGRSAGSRSSRRLRASGRIPGVIYGHGTEPIPVSVDARELRSALSGDAGLNALLSLDVNGTTHLALARELQRDPVRNTLDHVDFLIVRRDEVLAADVPITLAGEPGDFAGGVVEQVLNALTVSSTPDKIPHGIEVDITALKVGDTIRVSDLTLPSGVTTDVDPEEPVVIGQGQQAEETVELAEGEAVRVEVRELGGRPTGFTVYVDG